MSLSTWDSRALISMVRSIRKRLRLDESLSLTGWIARAGKRAIDLLGTLVILVLLAPVLLIIAIAIRLDSEGPILFRQKRIGRFGRPFTVFKFRTMVNDAEKHLTEIERVNETPQGLLNVKNDPRVTRVGRFLRRTSLDELPQLINVLRGEMSLVGPRPWHVRDCERMALLDPQAYELRLSVRPGVTGLAQVHGRKECSPHLILELDRDYASRWSLSRDITILYRTVGVVLSGEGAK
jgi:lipopolysaccharide/colanic/teichoic acid biosynthesis glycosyltransferase